MYLSRLILNLRTRTAQRCLSDCQQLHRTVMAGFPDGASNAEGGARERFGVLYRMDYDRRTGKAVLLVQSAEKPDWYKEVFCDLLAPVDNNPAVKPIESLYEELMPGQILTFRLRANVTRRVGKHSHVKCVPGEPEYENASESDRRHISGNAGKRVEIWGEDRQLEWLKRKAAAGGFELLKVAIGEVAAVTPNPLSKETGFKEMEIKSGNNPGAIKREKRKISLGGVLFEGYLRVTDAKAFRETIRRGIGPGKAYGFGLLSIAPAGE